MLCGGPLKKFQVDIVDTTKMKVDIFMKHTMLCHKCNTEKERKLFKRLATLAQSRAWIGNPLSTKRITYTGKECNECHKQTVRKNTELTPNELHRRLINEGVNPFLVQARVAKRRAQGSKKKSVVASRAMKAHWQTKKSNNEER